MSETSGFRNFSIMGLMKGFRSLPGASVRNGWKADIVRSGEQTFYEQKSRRYGQSATLFLHRLPERPGPSLEQAE